MPIHDSYARVTPFELVFPEGGEARNLLAAMLGGADSRDRGVSLRDPGRFLALPEVGRLLRTLLDPSADADEIQKHGILVFHAAHFLEAGQPLYFLTTRAARYLVEAAPRAPDRGSSEPPAPPERGAYLQLPRQLFWIEPVPAEPPEPVDGVFWTSPDGEVVSLLVVSGIRKGRPGFSVVPVPAVPLEHAEEWLVASVRETGPDFQSTLPGGDLERLYSLEATGEVLKLVAWAFRHLREVPDAVTEEGPARDAEEEPPSGPRPTTLSYRRIDLDEQTETESEEEE